MASNPMRDKVFDLWNSWAQTAQGSGVSAEALDKLTSSFGSACFLLFLAWGCMSSYNAWSAGNLSFTQMKTLIFRHLVLCSFALWII